MPVQAIWIRKEAEEAVAKEEAAIRKGILSDPNVDPLLQFLLFTPEPTPATMTTTTREEDVPSEYYLTDLDLQEEVEWESEEDEDDEDDEGFYPDVLPPLPEGYDPDEDTDPFDPMTVDQQLRTVIS